MDRLLVGPSPCEGRISGRLANVGGRMSDDSGSETRRYCPSCGAEAKPGISNCEKCWRPLPIGASGTPPVSAPSWTLKPEPPDAPRQNEPVPVLKPPAPTANRSATGEQVPARESAAPVKRKRGKKTVLIAAIALVLIVGGLIAQTAIKETSVSQTQSYKDGYSWGQNYVNSGAATSDDESVSTTCSFAWGVYNGVPGRGIPSSDNEGQWTQGCIAGLNTALK